MLRIFNLLASGYPSRDFDRLSRAGMTDLKSHDVGLSALRRGLLVFQVIHQGGEEAGI